MAVGVLAAFALRVFRLGEQNVWWDEALAIWAVRQSFAGVTAWTASDVHPPLFFWTLWGWVRLVGQTELAARFLTVVWGVLTVALAGAIGLRLAGRPAGVIAVVLVAVSPFEVAWSQELRMYMLASLAGLAAVYAAFRWVDDGGRWLFAYAVAALAALHTVYLAGVTVAVLNLGIVATAAAGRIDRRRLAAWLAAHVAIVGLFLPWWGYAAGRMQSWQVAEAPAAPGFIARLWATLLATGVSTDIERAGPATAACGAALTIAAVRAWGRLPRWRPRWSAPPSRPPGPDLRSSVWSFPWIALALFVVLPPAAVWLATRPRSLFYAPAVEARYFVPFAAPAYVLAGVVLARAWRRGAALGAVLVAVVVLTALAHLAPHFAGRRWRDETRAMALAIWTQAEPGDAVVLVSGNRYPMFLYDYDMPWDRGGRAPAIALPDDGRPGSANRPPVIPFPSRGSDQIGEVGWQAGLEAIVAGHDRVWLAAVDRHLQDPDGRLEAWLDDRLPRVLSEAYGADALHLYARDGRAPRLTMLSSAMPGLSATRAPRLPAFGEPARVGLPGDRLDVTLFLAGAGSAGGAPGAGAGGPPATLRLVAAEGDVPVWEQAVPGAPPGTALQRRRAVIDVSERLPTGSLGLRLDWGSAGDGRGAAATPLVRVGVRGGLPAPDPPFAWPSPPPAGAPLADVGFARLVDFRVAPKAIAPGAPVAVDLLWEVGGSPIPATAPVVFVHVLGPPRPETGDPVWAGHDGPPSSGPWRTGAVFDRHVVRVDPAAPAGTYLVEVGAYDPSNLERYPISGPAADTAGRRAILDEVEVR